MNLYAPRLALPPGTPVRVRIRARDVMIATRPPSDLSALNVLEGKIAEVGGGDAASVEIRLDCRGESLVARLTPREHEVFLLLVRGKPHKQIAYEMGTSERTVKLHRHNVMQKFQVRSLAELAVIAERLDLLAVPGRRGNGAASEPRDN